jgi:hypothetical protein
LFSRHLPPRGFEGMEVRPGRKLDQIWKRYGGSGRS